MGGDGVRWVVVGVQSGGGVVGGVIRGGVEGWEW